MIKKIGTILGAVTFLLFSTTAMAQTDGQFRTNEISLGYGILPATSWIDMITDMFVLVTNVGIENPVTIDAGETGAFTASYYHRFNNIFSLGGSYTYSRINKRIKNADTGLYIGKAASNYHTIMPAVKINWLNRGIISLYSKASIGIVVGNYGESYDNRYGNEFNETTMMFAFQLSPVGIEAGRNLAGFLEAGIGNTGTISAGIRYRF